MTEKKPELGLSENWVPYTNQVIIMFSVGVFTSFSAIERLEAN
jgi:hypothetical protein